MTPTLEPNHQNGYHGTLREIRGSMQFPKLEPPAADVAPPSPGLAEVLSPSQVSTFLSCSARWWFKYGLQLPSMQGSALLLGKALHSALASNFREKIESKRDLPAAGVLALYNQTWAEEREQTEFRADEDENEIKASGAACVQKYLDEIAWRIQPRSVELPVEGEIAGVPVRGIVDLLDVDGRIVDLKSANKSPSKNIRPDHRFQVATYSRLAPGACGLGRLDTVVKLRREVRIVQQRFEVSEADEKQLDVLYPLVQESMRSGLVWPNRNSYLCSRKYCPYATHCVAEFGGEVPGEEGGE